MPKDKDDQILSNDEKISSSVRPLKLSPEVAKTIAKAFGTRQAALSASSEVLGSKVVSSNADRPSTSSLEVSVPVNTPSLSSQTPLQQKVANSAYIGANQAVIRPGIAMHPGFINPSAAVFPFKAQVGVKPLKVAFAGGGTGGHLYPALAVAEVMRGGGGVQTLFFDAYKGVGRSIAERLGFRLRNIHAQGLSGSWSDKLIAVCKMGLGFFESLYHLLVFKPDILVASGGYVSVPVSLAAACLDIPILLMEQNAFMGKSAKLIASFAQRVCVSLPGNYTGVEPSKLVMTGNPVRTSILLKGRAEARQALNIPAERKCVAVVGGSQGAASLNKAVLALLPTLLDMDLTLIHLTGQKHIDEISSRSGDLVSGRRIDYRPMAYTDDMASVYGAADLVICRAGATTLAEVTARKLPSILVPYPYAAENHQEANARVLEKNGAAKVILDNQIESELSGSLLSLLNDEDELKKMAVASGNLGRPRASEAVIAQILQVISHNRLKALPKIR
ncbi:MAG: undecaprenyldiphospho-muramoylpentapeptide beta-N-acetylglucosaminyltransferase [Candidatus Bruticola sp.]